MRAYIVIACDGIGQVQMSRWLFIDDGPACGAVNMATDEFLLARSELSGGEPVLRLYSFRPAAVTIGYHQDPEALIDIGALARDGIDLVRRITGGRTLLHDGEITYCVAAAHGAGIFGTGLVETYVKISTALAGALRSLGIDAVLSNGRRCERGPGMKTPCLVSTARYEISAGARKIVCSSQRRTKRAFLQHGSILVRPASHRIVSYIGGDWGQVRERVTSISEELGTAPSGSEITSAVVASFSSLFCTGPQPLEFSEADREDVSRRARAKRAEFAHLYEPEVSR